MYINIDAVAVSLNEINIVYFINLFTIVNMLLNLTSHAEFLNFNNLMIRLSAQVTYRSHRSELSLDIRLSQTNFYSAKLNAD